MAITQADLNALDTAIASGTLEVEYQGRKQRFQTTTELLKARDHVARVVAGSASSGIRAFKFQFTTSRGD